MILSALGWRLPTSNPLEIERFNLSPRCSSSSSFFAFSWWQDGILDSPNFICGKKPENIPEWWGRKESSLQLLLTGKCRYINLCFTDGRWKVNIVSDGFVWRAEKKFCSDSPTYLNFQAGKTLAHPERCTKSNLGDCKENQPQKCGFVTPRSVPQRGTVIRRCCWCLRGWIVCEHLITAFVGSNADL